MTAPRSAGTASPATDRPAVPYTSLSRVMQRLEAILAPALDRPFWLRAEISSASERRGAFYCDLVETDPARGTVIAKVRCMVWADTLVRIRARFAREGLDLSLANGSVIGVQCVVRFHAEHGLSLNVVDMDPAFVLGELELRRRRILEALTREGLLGRNRLHAVPLLPARIALLTSGSGAAFRDFTQTLHAAGFGIRVLLADCIMQGPQTESALLRGLATAERLRVDLVVLIRGGGSKTDLGWLDSEAVARRIASLNIPVWTGIGHETDRSVLDAVSAESFRTPTAAAEALVARFARVEATLDLARTRLRSVFERVHRDQCERLERKQTGLRQGTRKLLELRRAELQRGAGRLQLQWTRRLARGRESLRQAVHAIESRVQARVWRTRTRLGASREQLQARAAHALERAGSRTAHAAQRLSPRRVQQRLERERQLLHERLRLLRACDPERALARGYSLTVTRTGQLVRTIRALQPGEQTVTRLADGSFTATIQTIEETRNGRARRTDDDLRGEVREARGDPEAPRRLADADR